MTLVDDGGVVFLAPGPLGGQAGEKVGVFLLRFATLLGFSICSLLAVSSVNAATQGEQGAESSAMIRITVNILPKIAHNSQIRPISVNIPGGASSVLVCGLANPFGGLKLQASGNAAELGDIATDSNDGKYVLDSIDCNAETSLAKLSSSQTIPSVNKNGHIVLTITPF